jgi:hypothetical protein
MGGKGMLHLAHAQWLDYCNQAITDTIKDVSRTLSGHADVDLHCDAVYAGARLLWLRQRSASLDPLCGDVREFIGSSGNASPILRW